MNKDDRIKELEDQIATMEGIDFSYVDKGGKVKMIAWGKDYMKWEIEQRLHYAESLASAMNEACELIQNERNNLAIQNKSLKESLEASEKSLADARQINVNNITRSNADKQDLIKKIRELEIELKLSKEGALK